MRRLLKKQKWQTIGVLLVTFLPIVLFNYSSFSLFFIVDVAFGNNANTSVNIPVLIGLLVAFVVGYILGYLVSLIADYLQTKHVTKMVLVLKIELNNHLHWLQYQNIFENKPDYLNYYLNDLQIIEENALTNFFTIFKTVFSALLQFVLLVILNWVIGLVALGFYLLFLVSPYFMNRFYAKETLLFKQRKETYLQKSRKHLEAINTLFANQKLHLLPNKLLKPLNQQYAKTNIRYRIATILKSNLFVLISFLVTLLLIYIQAQLFLNNVFEFTNLAPILLTSFIIVFNFLKDAFALYDLTTTFQSGVQVLQKFWNNLQTIAAQKPTVDQNTICKLSLQKLSFQTPDKNLFNGLDYEFHKGQKYLVVGPSGVGKSTLGKIIANYLTPSAGTVLINNQPVVQNHIYTKIGYVANDSFLLADSLQNNIVLNTNQPFNQAKYAQLLELLELTHLDNNAVLEAQNLNVSTGEQQRINLARYLYEDYDLLILDEALSNLNLALVQKIENYLLNQKTLILINITHHFDDAKKALYDAMLDLSTNA